ncbi:MAG: serine protease [Polyangiaceae bacterium]
MKTPLSDLAAHVRPAVVGVLSPAGRGTGYCALPNGLVVTSLEVVGYEREVQLMIEDGNLIPAAVIRANVALDVALLVPLEPAPITPVQLGAEPRLTDEVFIVGRLGNEPYVQGARITSVMRICEGFGHLQLDIIPEEALRGAPVFDAQGGCLGLIVRPRRVRLPGDRTAHKWLAGLVLPNAAFEGGLMSADGAPESLLELAPEYGCPRCDTIFEPEMDRCLECGALLPHQWQRENTDPDARTPTPLKGLYAVRAALASMGIPANRARVDARTWRFSPAFQGQDVRSQVDLTTDATGDFLVMRAPLARLPLEGFESVYRHLLTLNDETAGPYRFGVVDGIIYLSTFEPVRGVDTSRFPSTVSDFSRALGAFRAALDKHFGLEPAYEHETD